MPRRILYSSHFIHDKIGHTPLCRHAKRISQRDVFHRFNGKLARRQHETGRITVIPNRVCTKLRIAIVTSMPFTIGHLGIVGFLRTQSKNSHEVHLLPALPTRGWRNLLEVLPQTNAVLRYTVRNLAG